MVRLPTEREVQKLAQAHLEELWVDVSSAEDFAVVFDDLGRIIKAPLDMQSRICLAGAMAGYCSGIMSALEADEIAEAKRLVKAARREISDLQKRLKGWERQLSATREGSRKRVSEQANRECWSIYQSAKQRCEQLHSLAGAPAGDLRKPVAVMDDALRKVGWPFLDADCGAALSILDKALSGWAAATGSTKGQTIRSREFNSLIIHLGVVFEDATGRRPAAGNRFLPFLKRILKALPPGVYREGSEELLPTRVKRRLRKRPATAF